MDRRALKFISKRSDIESDSTHTATSNASYLPTQPLKDNSNIRIIKVNSEYAQQIEKQQQQQQQQPQAITATTNGSANSNNKSNERPLKCLETLAQKAGITFDEKYDFASPPHPGVHGHSNNSSISLNNGYSAASSIGASTIITSTTTTSNTQKGFTLEKSQSPAQQVAPSTVPLQISPEQLQQLQQLQLQHGSHFAAIQVKQEFPTHTTSMGGSGATGELKHAGLLDPTQANQLQQMQMQLADASAGAPGSPATQQTPSSAAAAVAAMQQHSTTISTMSPMQLATTPVLGDWSQGGRTVQLMPQQTALNSTSFLYPTSFTQVSGNLIHTGLGQSPIQVITKPFQGGAPQMITTQNAKQMIGGNTGFPSGAYAIPSSQSPQTLLFTPVLSQSPQQQHILQTMAQQQQQQQQQQQNAKVNADAQKNLQQKVVQKVTTTTNTVQSATGTGGGVAAVQQQQQQQSTQQCVQVSQGTMPTATQIISPLQGTTGATQPMQITAPWVQSLPFWSNGLQQPIIIRGTQPDGTPGMYIQQPATHQTIQTQQPNQITLQCNVTQAPPKPRNQMEALAPKQQSQQQQQQQAQQQQAAQTVVAQLQQAAAAVAAGQLQQQVAAQRMPQILPQNGAQIRPASSVSTQTAQNQIQLKQKPRNKQQAVRPAIPAMKTENGQQQQAKTQTISAATAAGLQQQGANMHQVGKMVVMNTSTPITIQNGQAMQQATTASTHVDKQQQQIQLQQMQIQKQQQALLQQQLLQQQMAQIQLQQQHQQQQQQQQQQLTQQPQQIQLQVTPQTFIAQQQQQQQQQQQLQNQFIQQQQQLAQQQQQQREQQQQQHQQQNINYQFVLQASPQQQQQQQQQTHSQQQQQITSVPFSVSSSTPSSIASSSAAAAALQQHVTYQSKAPTLPTTSVVSISNQTGPLVTSTVGINQAAQLQQNLMAATMAATQQQQQQQQQSQMGPPAAPTTAPTQSPLIGLTSMMNAPIGSIVHSSPSTTVTTAITMSSPIGTTGQASSLPSTPLKVVSSEQIPAAMQQSQQLKSSVSAPSTPTSVSIGSTIVTSVVSVGSSATTTSTTSIAGTTATSYMSEVKETPSKSVTEAPKALSAQQRVEYSSPSTTTATAMTSVSTANANSMNGEATQSPPMSVNTTPPPSTGSATSPSAVQASPAKGIASTTQSPAASPNKAAATGSRATETAKTTSTTEAERATASSNNEESPVVNKSSSNALSMQSAVPKSTPGATIAKVEKELPKAMIKPNVLTHVIDGFIIQEANEPFPVTRQRYTDKDSSDEPPKKKMSLEEVVSANNNNSTAALPPDMVACEQCGKVEHKSKLKKKRFCSLTCARQSKSSLSEQQNDLAMNNNSCDTANKTNTVGMNNGQPEKMVTETIANSIVNMTNAKSNTSENSTAGDSAMAVGADAVPAVVERPPMADWSVAEVCEFIKQLPGCSDYVDDFEQQEIDGQALMLLKENHLVNAMGMKLGPALKIVAKVESMKEIVANAVAAAEAKAAEKEAQQ